jgi:hypothetical protein
LHISSCLAMTRFLMFGLILCNLVLSSLPIIKQKTGPMLYRVETEAGSEWRRHAYQILVA